MTSRNPQGVTVQRALKWLVALTVVLAAIRLAPMLHFEKVRESLPGAGPRLAVIGITCTRDGGMPRAVVQVRNTGRKPVQSVTGVVRFAKEVQDGRFVPDVIAPGSDARMTVYADGNDLGECELLVVRDRLGRNATLANLSRFNNPENRTPVLE